MFSIHWVLCIGEYNSLALTGFILNYPKLNKTVDKKLKTRYILAKIKAMHFLHLFDC